jgi:5-methyltetrahydrofolate--homocysteine methyltransferase
MSGRGAELFELLDRGGVVLGDGAMGTLLQTRGIEPGGAAELWNVEHADTIAAIHTEYAEAGARLVTTNTFGGTSARLALHGLQDRVVELNLAGARIAREVADRFDGWVLGDVGPTGELIAPLGVVEPGDVKAMFAEQIAALVQGGADVILVETMSDLAEVEAAVEAAAEVAPGLPVAATLTFDTHGHTMMGVSPERAAEALASLGARIVGGNCGNGPHEIGPVMSQMAERRPSGVHLIAQSNAGMPRLTGADFHYDGTPEVMAEYALQMRELGVGVIGACCGSTPAHVAAMRAALDLAPAGSS